MCWGDYLEVQNGDRVCSTCQLSWCVGRAMRYLIVSNAVIAVFLHRLIGGMSRFSRPAFWRCCRIIRKCLVRAMARSPLSLITKTILWQANVYIARGRFIKRSAFGIGSGAWSDTDMVADEVTVRFKLMLVPLKKLSPAVRLSLQKRPLRQPCQQLACFFQPQYQ